MLASHESMVTTSHVVTSIGILNVTSSDYMESLTTNVTSDDEMYEYDVNADMDMSYVAEITVVSVVYGLTLILGSIGNILMIVCIARFRRMRSATNMFLVSLASADLLLVCVFVPIKLARWLTFTWTFGKFLCKFVHYIQNVSVICSVLSLMMISMERYYAILRPMQSRYICTCSRAKKLIFLLWFVSLVFALPIIYGQIHKQVGAGRQIGDHYWCVKEWDNPLEEKAYEIGMLFLVLVIPLAGMSFAYASICYELSSIMASRSCMTASSQLHNVSGRKTETETPTKFNNTTYTGNSFEMSYRMRKSSSNAAHAHHTGNDDTRTKKQVIKMLVTIVVLFAVCWTPTLVDNVLVAFGVIDRLHMGPIKYVRQAFVLMSYFNSCVNPIVYAFMSKNFRKGFKNALCACTRSSSGRGRNRRAGTNRTGSGSQKYFMYGDSTRRTRIVELG